MKRSVSESGNIFLVACVLVATFIIGGCSSNPSTTNNATPIKINPPAKTIPANAPPGAQPPNQINSPTATVVLEEFADFQCGSCALKHPVLNEIKSMYGSRIRFIFRNFPLDIHPKAYDAAVAAGACCGAP